MFRCGLAILLSYLVLRAGAGANQGRLVVGSSIRTSVGLVLIACSVGMETWALPPQSPRLQASKGHSSSSALTPMTRSRGVKSPQRYTGNSLITKGRCRRCLTFTASPRLGSYSPDTGLVRLAFHKFGNPNTQRLRRYWSDQNPDIPRDSVSCRRGKLPRLPRCVRFQSTCITC
jgi:hypothetical protein